MPDTLEARLLAECRSAERAAAAAEQVVVAAELAAGTIERYAVLAERRAEIASLAMGAAQARYRAYVAVRRGA